MAKSQEESIDRHALPSVCQRRLSRRRYACLPTVVSEMTAAAAGGSLETRLRDEMESAAHGVPAAEPFFWATRRSLPICSEPMRSVALCQGGL